ncbi:Ankyrin repeat protein [Mycena sanguinolenta]|uniref:Ankyrin repeat protein n=1 Tax=Mycena sanguinolenta TaxID=230812 RepID=A0A8H6ZG52_9AGAR|nr:Ankyrin repeat protein [Mycena sanguinolenta]
MAYFYFDTTNDRKRKLEDCLRTLISRLADSASHASSILESAWKSHANGAEAPSNQTLLEILLKILSGFATPVFILCDALDESSEVGLVLNGISKIVDAKINNVHVFLTSRTEITYGKELFSLATAVRLEGTKVNEDIASYVDHILTTDPDFSWSKEMKNDVRNSLVNQPDPMFRLVALQLDQLRNCLRESDITPALSSMPHTMNNIYDRILGNIQSEMMLGMVNQTLNWLIFSMRPMTLGEINDALAVDFAESPPRFDPKKRLSTPSKLLDACAGLVSATKDDWGHIKLQLAHASVKEYLTDTQRSSHALHAEISNYAGHYMIARTCIGYLCSFDNHQQLRLSPLGRYAAHYWHNHVNSCNLALSEPPTLSSPQRELKYQLGYAILLQLWESIKFPLAIILWPLEAIHLISKSPPSSQNIYKQPEQCDQSELITDMMNLLQARSAQYSNLLQLLRNGDTPPIVPSASLGVWPVVHLLFDRSADVKPIVLSASLGVLPAVQLLLDRGADVNVQGGVYSNALLAACHGGNTEIVQLLLDRGADVNAQGGTFGNVLQAACYQENTEIVQMLLDRGADVNAQGGHYGNGLQAACVRGNIEIVQMLLDRGADVNAQGGEYGNALPAACLGGNTEIVQMLLDRGADVNAQGGEYGNALQTACNKGNTEIVQMLLDRGADVNALGGRYGNALQAACNQGNIEIVQMLLDRGADVNDYDNVLQAACLGGNTGIVQLLLDRGADVNAQGGESGNALQAACGQGNIEIVQLLLQKGADVNAKGGYYSTALHAALSEEHTEIVQLLLQNGADPESSPHSGDSENSEDAEDTEDTEASEEEEVIA